MKYGYCVVFSITLASFFPAAAQVGTGAIAGKVLDPAGAVIPSAKVQITSEERGDSVRVSANAEGLYRAPNLLSGSYRIEVFSPGFETRVRAHVSVGVAETTVVDLELALGTRSQTIEVTSDAPVLNSDSSSLGQLVDHKMIDNLPVPNRAAASLVNLSPGVVMINSGEGAENYPVFSVAGGRARNQDFTLDGGNVTNAVGVTRPQQQTSLPLDAMQEFRVISNNYSAEYGHSTGGVIAMSTRSGAQRSAAVGTVSTLAEPKLSRVSSQLTKK